MRKKIVAGNWKMNMNLQEGIALAKELNEMLVNDRPNCEVVICTPFIHLASVAQLVDENVIKVGAENCADKDIVHAFGVAGAAVSAVGDAKDGWQKIIYNNKEAYVYSS